MRLGEFIKTQRLKRHWTVVELIERMGHTVSQSYISKIETWNEIPRPQVLLTLAWVLGIDYEIVFDIAKQTKLEYTAEMFDKKYKHSVLRKTP